MIHREDFQPKIKYVIKEDINKNKTRNYANRLLTENVPCGGGGATIIHLNDVADWSIRNQDHHAVVSVIQCNHAS